MSRGLMLNSRQLRQTRSSELAAVSFFRMPAWRYTRALSIVSDPTIPISSALDDELVCELAKYHRARARFSDQRLSDDIKDLKLYRKFPELVLADQFFRQQGYSAPKTALEARLLSGQPFDEIAKAIGMPEEIVRIYSMVYYDVVDRCDSIDYIAGYVIGPVLQSGLDVINPDLLAKYFTYFGGLTLLQVVQYGLSQNTSLKTDEEVLGFLDNQIARTVRSQVLTLTTLMQPTRFDVRSLLEGYTSVVALEQKLRSGQQEENWVAGLVEVLRRQTPVYYTGEERISLETAMSPASGGRIELRASEKEALLHSQDADVAAMVKEFSAYELPEATGPQNAKTNSKK